ncbi:MAG: REP-associated tyrosine transposase [Beijerinckiaceae bacterium]
MTADRRDPKGWHSRGYIPHFDSPETIQHIVFRTRDSLPKFSTDALPSDPALRRTAVDILLDESKNGRALSDPAAARLVEQAILRFDGVRYDIFAWCIMPNHVHVVMGPHDGCRAGDIIRSWKTFTAREINKLSGARGSFWAPDYFDRFLRNEDHLLRTLDYVEKNPVKAGLVANAADWPFSSARRRQGG